MENTSQNLRLIPSIIPVSQVKTLDDKDKIRILNYYPNVKTALKALESFIKSAKEITIIAGSKNILNLHVVDNSNYASSKKENDKGKDEGSLGYLLKDKTVKCHIWSDLEINDEYLGALQDSCKFYGIKPEKLYSESKNDPINEFLKSLNKKVSASKARNKNITSKNDNTSEKNLQYISIDESLNYLQYDKKDKNDNSNLWEDMEFLSSSDLKNLFDQLERDIESCYNNFISSCKVSGSEKKRTLSLLKQTFKDVDSILKDMNDDEMEKSLMETLIGALIICLSLDLATDLSGGDIPLVLDILFGSFVSGYSDLGCYSKNMSRIAHNKYYKPVFMPIVRYFVNNISAVYSACSPRLTSTLIICDDKFIDLSGLNIGFLSLSPLLDDDLLISKTNSSFAFSGRLAEGVKDEIISLLTGKTKNKEGEYSDLLVQSAQKDKKSLALSMFVEFNQSYSSFFYVEHPDFSSEYLAEVIVGRNKEPNDHTSLASKNYLIISNAPNILKSGFRDDITTKILGYKISGRPQAPTKSGAGNSPDFGDYDIDVEDIDKPYFLQLSPFSLSEKKWIDYLDEASQKNAEDKKGLNGNSRISSTVYEGLPSKKMRFYDSITDKSYINHYFKPNSNIKDIEKKWKKLQMSLFDMYKAFFSNLHVSEGTVYEASFMAALGVYALSCEGVKPEFTKNGIKIKNYGEIPFRITQESEKFKNSIHENDINLKNIGRMNSTLLNNKNKVIKISDIEKLYNGITKASENYVKGEQIPKISIKDIDIDVSSGNGITNTFSSFGVSTDILSGGSQFIKAFYNTFAGKELSRSFKGTSGSVVYKSQIEKMTTELISGIFQDMIAFAFPFTKVFFIKNDKELLSLFGKIFMELEAHLLNKDDYHKNEIFGKAFCDACDKVGLYLRDIIGGHKSLAMPMKSLLEMIVGGDEKLLKNVKKDRVTLVNYEIPSMKNFYLKVSINVSVIGKKYDYATDDDALYLLQERYSLRVYPRFIQNIKDIFSNLRKMTNGKSSVNDSINLENNFPASVINSLFYFIFVEKLEEYIKEYDNSLEECENYYSAPYTIESGNKYCYPMEVNSRIMGFNLSVGLFGGSLCTGGLEAFPNIISRCDNRYENFRKMNLTRILGYVLLEEFRGNKQDDIQYRQDKQFFNDFVTRDISGEEVEGWKAKGNLIKKYSYGHDDTSAINAYNNVMDIMKEYYNGNLGKISPRELLKNLRILGKNNIKAMYQGANGLKESSMPPIIGRLATTIIDIEGSYSGFSGEKDISIFR